MPTGRHAEPSTYSAPPPPVQGVMLTHKNLISDSAAGTLAGLRLLPTDVHVSYLPLAHMFERIVQISLWSSGARAIRFLMNFIGLSLPVISLSRSLTLPASGAACGFYRGDVQKLFDDINVLQPTIFCSVPRSAHVTQRRESHE